MILVQVLAYLDDNLAVNLPFQIVQTFACFIVQEVGDLRMNPYHNSLTVLEVCLLFLNAPKDLICSSCV